MEREASGAEDTGEAAGQVRIAFLPPMSGLAATETRLDPGAVNVRVGEGRTAEVLRNLCHGIHEKGTRWADLVGRIQDLFGAELRPPRYIAERGEIAMSYREHGIELDLSSGGRGLQQTLLLLAYMYANPGAVLLLDEPDAHLEILRQRQIYQLLADTAEASGSQIRGVGLFDRLDRKPPQSAAIEWLMWERREFENYLTTRRTLERYAAASGREATPGPLFAESEQTARVAAMRGSIEGIDAALRKLGKGSPWDPDIKASDDFLNPLFTEYFERLGLPNVMAKKSYHVLARHVPRDDINPEIKGKLDAIGRVAEAAEARA